MLRRLFVVAACLSVTDIAVTVQAQCGSASSHYGGTWSSTSDYRYSRPYYGGGYSRQPYYSPQANYYQSRPLVPSHASGYYHDVYSAPSYGPATSVPQGSAARAYHSVPVSPSQPVYQPAPTYSVPQGSATREYNTVPFSPSQPAYQPAPTYSAPQGSGSRSYPSQGSGSR